MAIHMRYLNTCCILMIFLFSCYWFSGFSAERSTGEKKKNTSKLTLTKDQWIHPVFLHFYFFFIFTQSAYPKWVNMKLSVAVTVTGRLVVAVFILSFISQKQSQRSRFCWCRRFTDAFITLWVVSLLPRIIKPGNEVLSAALKWANPHLNPSAPVNR